MDLYNSTECLCGGQSPMRWFLVFMSLHGIPALNRADWVAWKTLWKCQCVTSETRHQKYYAFCFALSWITCFGGKQVVQGSCQAMMPLSSKQPWKEIGNSCEHTALTDQVGKGATLQVDLPAPVQPSDDAALTNRLATISWEPWVRTTRVCCFLNFWSQTLWEIMYVHGCFNPPSFGVIW